MKTKLLTSLLFVLALAACESTGPKINTVPVIYQIVATPIEIASLTEVEALGYEIYLRDIVASRATDAVLASYDLRAMGAVGYIVVKQGDSYVTRFINGDEESVIDAFLNPFNRSPAWIEHNLTPVPLEAEELAMWRARQTALDVPFSPCSNRYNTVVVSVPGSSGESWYVYLLAATMDPYKMMLGGHQRFTFDASGAELFEHFPMTRACMEMLNYEGTASIYLTHIVSDEPMENHIYLNHIYGMPIMLMIPSTGESYVIDKGRSKRQEK